MPRWFRYCVGSLICIAAVLLFLVAAGYFHFLIQTGCRILKDHLPSGLQHFCRGNAFYFRFRRDLASGQTLPGKALRLTHDRETRPGDFAHHGFSLSSYLPRVKPVYRPLD